MLFKTLRQDPFPGVGNDQGPSTPWYSSLYTNSPTTASYGGTKPDLQLCDYWEQQTGNLTGGGNFFQYVYLDVSGETPSLISAGVTVTPSAPATDTVAGSLTDAATGLVYGITLVSGGLTPNAEVGNILFMEDLGIQKVILYNTATDVWFALFDTLPRGPDANAIAAGPANSSNVSIIRPGHVVANTNPGPPTGVLINDALEGQFIVVQIRGEAMMVGNNSGEPLVVNKPGSAISGGYITGDAPSGVASMWDALILPQVAYDGPNILIPCYFKAAGF